MPEIDRDKLRRCRLERGYTQAELSQRSRVSLTTIQRAETWARQSSFSVRTFRKLAAALSTSELKVVPEDLLYSEEW